MNFFKIVRNPEPFGTSNPMEITVDFAYDQWMKATSPEAMQNVLNVSDRYMGSSSTEPRRLAMPQRHGGCVI